MPPPLRITTVLLRYAFLLALATAVVHLAVWGPILWVGSTTWDGVARALGVSTPDLLVGLSWFTLGTLLLPAPLFILWIATVVAAIRGQGSSPPVPKPTEIVVEFLVPILNIFAPALTLVALLERDTGSEPRRRPGKSDVVVLAWWVGSWLTLVGSVLLHLNTLMVLALYHYTSPGLRLYRFDRPFFDVSLVAVDLATVALALLSLSIVRTLHRGVARDGSLFNRAAQTLD